MSAPGHHHHVVPNTRYPAKPDRWLVGLVAGVALMYWLGKTLGLGKRSASPAPRHPKD